jgi:hypothetical protein
MSYLLSVLIACVSWITLIIPCSFIPSIHLMHHWHLPLHHLLLRHHHDRVLCALHLLHIRSSALVGLVKGPRLS